MISFGGGLALFYMISGYVLVNINENSRFYVWYLKKVTRLYISLITLRLIEIVVEYIEIRSAQIYLSIVFF